MRRVRLSRVGIPAFAITGLIMISLVSCSDGGGPAQVQAPAPTTGEVTVTTTTTGDAPDPDGYSLSVDGAASGAIGVNATSTLTLAGGSHEIELQGVAANCTVAGSNPRTVSVTAGGTATTAFSVSCATPTGNVDVSTTTTGDSPDPDGYSLSVDGVDQGAIGVSAARSLTLDEGSHSVELTDVAANCTVAGQNPNTVTVTAGQTTAAAFAVDCPTAQGTIDVTTVTTGPSPDADGYGVEVDAGAATAIAINETISLTVDEGTRSVHLTGVAPNCIVAGQNPRDVAVTGGQAAPTTFTVDCQAGALQVTTVTTGDEPDPDGYAISIDAVPTGAIGTDETVGYGVDAGTRSVELTGMAPNCVVAGANPRNVDVTAGQAATTTFDVDCPTVQGTVEVTTNTTGASPDADGYNLTIGGQQQGAIGVNETRSIDVDPGTASVFLSGLAFNCTVSGDNPRSVDVPAGGTVATTFDVDCPTISGTLEVTTTTTGAIPDPDGYGLTVGGSDQGAIGLNETRSVTLDQGQYAVLLTGVAANCTVAGANPRNETVSTNQVTATAFAVDCPNTSPGVSITSPTDGGSVAEGGNVTFTGSATDLEDGALTGGSLVWKSNLQGQIGTGETFNTSSLVDGPHLITLTAMDSGAGEGAAQVTFTVIRTPGAGYEIDIRVSEGSELTAAQRTVVDAAVAKWEAVITGDLPDVPVNTTIPAGFCAAFVGDVNETVDDVVIYLEFVPIDGPGSILGAAGPCWVRNTGLLTVIGGMRFDVADLDFLDQLGLFEAVILHEMGHVLGIGSLWDPLGFITNPSVVQPGNDTSGPIVDTHFTGAEAIAAFDALGGASYTGGDKVPVENDKTTYGLGSLDSHWREGVFANELMTPSVNLGLNPLSILTIESLEDIGYTVDPGAADPYSQVFTLRAAPQAAGFSIDLHNDMWQGPLYAVDQAGNVRRIR